VKPGLPPIPIQGIALSAPIAPEQGNAKIHCKSRCSFEAPISLRTHFLTQIAPTQEQERRIPVSVSPNAHESVHSRFVMEVRNFLQH
jgi:hypothetical protein